MHLFFLVFYFSAGFVNSSNSGSDKRTLTEAKTIETTPKTVDPIFVRTCMEYNISHTDCKCPELKKYNQSLCRTSKKQPKKRHINQTKELYLKKVCKSKNISLENCTCPEIDEFVKGFCHFLRKSFDNSTIITTHYINNNTLGKYFRGQIIFISFTSIIGMLGNSIVLIVRWQSLAKSLHYQLIFGLALADFIFSILQLIYYVPYIIVGVKWIYGALLCKILPSSLGLSSSIDLGFIVIIALERFISIVYPLSEGITTHRLKMLISLNVILGIISVIPMLLILEISPEGICFENLKKFPNVSLTYTWTLTIIFFLVPVAITSYLYYQSIQALKKTLFRKEMLNKLDTTSKNKLIAENKRILMVLSSLLVAFVLLVSPNRITMLIVDYLDTENIPHSVYDFLKMFGFIPYSLHVSVNPLIYSVVDKRFRRDTRMFIRRQKRKYGMSSVGTSHITVDSMAM